MITMYLNRRHKAGLFLVLVATGLSLFFEASAKQTAGIVLLGVAATWLFGSVSLRVLGFGFSSLACVVGLYVAILPILNERDSYLAASADYDLALAEIRSAVARAPFWEVVPPPPKGFVLEPAPATLPADFFERRDKQKDPSAFDVGASTTERRNAQPLRLPPGAKLVEPQYQRGVVFPAAAEKWLRQDGVVAGWVHVLKGKNVTVPFPADASAEAIIAEFQANHLLPRPTYSIAAAIRSHRAPFLGGVVLVAAGLLGFAGMLWTDRRSKRAASVSAM